MRTIALALTVSLLALGVPAASAAVCEYDPRPRLSRAERDLRDTIASRKGAGLPHGRAFVQRVNASPAARRRGYELLDFPMTKREAAYFRLRFRFQDPRDTRRLDRYLARQGATFSGVSIEDDYPRSPYMLVRFTSGLERHRRAIARRFSLRFVVRRSRYTLWALQRVSNRIDPDALEREGIHALSWGVGSDRVELDVTTPRADAPEVVRRLYGPAVRVRVVAATPTYLACGSPEGYRVEPDGRTLTVTFTDSGSITPKEVEVVEGAGEVRVGVVTERPYGAETADAVPYTLSVTLAEPLGERVVRSIRTGRRVASAPAER